MSRGTFAKRDARVLESLGRYISPTSHELARLMSMPAVDVARALRSLLAAGKVRQIPPTDALNLWDCGVLRMRVSRWTALK